MSAIVLLLGANIAQLITRPTPPPKSPAVAVGCSQAAMRSISVADYAKVRATQQRYHLGPMDADYVASRVAESPPDFGLGTVVDVGFVLFDPYECGFTADFNSNSTKLKAPPGAPNTEADGVYWIGAPRVWPHDKECVSDTWPEVRWKGGGIILVMNCDRIVPV